MFKDIFVQGSQAMISTLSWSGSVSGYPEPDSSLEMYEVPDGTFRKSSIREMAKDDEEDPVSEDVSSGRLSLVHQVQRRSKLQEYFEEKYLGFFRTLVSL